jgi:hypothetical protein
MTILDISSVALAVGGLGRVPALAGGAGGCGALRPIVCASAAPDRTKRGSTCEVQGARPMTLAASVQLFSTCVSELPRFGSSRKCNMPLFPKSPNSCTCIAKSGFLHNATRRHTRTPLMSHVPMVHHEGGGTQTANSATTPQVLRTVFLRITDEDSWPASSS